MRREVLWTVLLAASSAGAQTAGITNASVSGVVKDATTGQPLANYNVSTFTGASWFNDTTIQSAQTKQVNSVTDEQGRYQLKDLPPGEYRIDAVSTANPGTRRQKRITLAGQDLEHLDFQVKVAGKISGRVLDENKEPVPNMTVCLISKEYYYGTLGYYIKRMARTDDRGGYALTGVEAGHSYLVLAEKFELPVRPQSEAPLDPKLRRRVPMRTYYPNSPAREGAEALVLRPGEHRERVDIELKKSPAFCLQGTLLGSMGGGPLTFGIEALQPSSGTSSGGGLVRGMPGGKTGPDGKLRVCDLAPGVYRLTAIETGATANPQGPVNIAMGNFTITDRDLVNVKLAASPGMRVEGEVVWAGDPPDMPVTAKVNLFLANLARGALTGERNSARAEIPGTFTLPSVIADDYGVRAFVMSSGLYLKDVTYAGQSVLHEPLRLGSALPGAGLRVIVGRDGATLGARVTDADGNPVSGIPVLIVPKDTASEAVVQHTMVRGETDQRGTYTSHPLAPGTYYVAAVDDAVDATTESIDRLWRSRSRFQEVELPPGGSKQVTLAPVKLQ